MRADSGPAPNTVWSASRYRSQPRQLLAASASGPRLRASGTNSSAPMADTQTDYPPGAERTTVRFHRGRHGHARAMSTKERADDQSVHDDFRDAVNMTATEIEDWLGTDDSKKVGQKSGDDESTGHASGRRIVKILRAKKADL